MGQLGFFDVIRRYETRRSCQRPSNIIRARRTRRSRKAKRRKTGNPSPPRTARRTRTRAGRRSMAAASRADAQKKSLRAAEQDRADIVEARREWRWSPPDLNPERLVFLDETGAKTNMVRLYGRAPVVNARLDLRCGRRLPLRGHGVERDRKSPGAEEEAAVCPPARDHN